MSERLPVAPTTLLSQSPPIAAVRIITVPALRREGRLHHQFENFELSGPHCGRFRIGWTIHCGLRDCSRLEKPKAQVVSVGSITSPMRNAIALAQTTI
jgi:hypothetical protein